MISTLPQPMNNTLAIPLASVVQNGELAYRWLGSLWTQLFAQPELIRNDMHAQGMLSAQLYLDFLETLALSDRRNAPVFHRDRWQLIRLKRSERNTGKAVAVKLGGMYQAQIGPQNAAPFNQGAYVEVGGYTGMAGVTTYPLPPGTADLLTSITDSIVAPTRVLLRGVDFYVADETIIFLNDNDPMTSGFPIGKTDGGDEVGLWASDVLVDKNYTANHIGYVLDVQAPSSEFYAKYLNAIWDLYTAGASLALVRAGVAAILNEPYILDNKEVVEDIIRTDSKCQVITDTHVYDVPVNAVLRAVIAPGAVLEFGEVLTETVRVYDNLDPTRLSAGAEYGARIRDDVDALFLPPGFFRAELKHGLGLTWAITPIVYAGPDKNNNPKVKFTVYGTDADINAFWADFWGYCETRNIASTTCFPDRLHATLPPVENAIWGSISPVEYFMYNYLKSNLLIVVIDGDKLSALGRSSMHILAMLHAAVPAHVCLLLMERRTVPTDEYDAGENVADRVKPIICKQFNEIAGANEYPKYRLTYGDARPIVHLIPKCVGAADENN